MTSMIKEDSKEFDERDFDENSSHKSELHVSEPSSTSKTFLAGKDRFCEEEKIAQSGLVQV